MQLNHERRGSGTPLALLHPLGGDLRVWDPVVERLAAVHEVLALDMPGFGDSTPLAGGATPTPRALASAVATFLDEAGLEGVHAAGISLGGWVALELARMGRALSVTALCPAGFWSRPLGPRRETARHLARLLLPVMPLLVRSAAGRRRVLSSSVARPERVPPDAALGLVRAYATAPGFLEASLAMRAGVVAGLEEVEVPITLAWAEHDRLVKPPRRPLPGIRSVTLPGCGHVPTWDDPDLVARVLLEGCAALAPQV